MIRRWLLLLALLLAFGLAGPGHSVTVHAATCVGATPCKACKNCSSCKHCAKQGGTCGVCKRK